MKPKHDPDLLARIADFRRSVSGPASTDGFESVVQIMARKGWSEDRARLELKLYSAAGVLEVGRRSTDRNIAGQIKHVPVYRVKPEATK